MYGQGGEQARLAQAKSREQELKDYTRQNALDARQQAKANKQRVLDSMAQEERDRQAVEGGDGGGGGGGRGAFDATPVDQMQAPPEIVPQQQQQQQPRHQQAASVDDDRYADEAPRERMMRQKRERQDAERQVHEQQLADARKQAHEDRKRVAALRSPGGAAAAAADDSGHEAARIASAKEKEAAWRAKQQQGLDAVVPSDKLPSISPARTRPMTPDQFEVQEGGGSGMQQLPPQMPPREYSSADYGYNAEPEPQVDRDHYTAESFDDYDTIVGEVEEEVLEAREGQFDSMRDIMAGVLVEEGAESTGGAAGDMSVDEDISMSSPSPQLHGGAVGGAAAPGTPTGRDPLTTHGLEARIEEIKDELLEVLGAVRFSLTTACGSSLVLSVLDF